MAPSSLEILFYFEQHPEPDKALEEGQNSLLKEYAASVEHNSEKNKKRYSLLLWSQRFSFFTLALIICCLPMWLYHAIRHIPGPQSVRIVSQIEIAKEKSMSDSNTQSAEMTLPRQTGTQSQTQEKTQAKRSPSTAPSATVSQPRPIFPTRKMVLDEVDVIDPND
uniref:Uncharacterized protein n=1 Tax=Candidatus Kentrum sp. LFY TaxID=2126342 RepID=A0A450UGH9_9GAMM|nr:MAG: hypothetical protein BECKLFY1418A_GA0070994_101725 [Candidatus Kentron sp. LFY]